MADIAELIVALKLRDGLSAGLGNLNRQLSGMQSGLGNIGRGIGQVGSGIDRTITRLGIATAGLGVAVVTTAASFEQAEAGIRKTVGGTTDEVDDLVASIKDMSRTVPLSFEELAAIAAEGGALGIATTGLANFTDVVARLGVSTDLTTEQASAALGQLANVLDLGEEDLRDFGDALVALGNDGASTESQILDMTARFGAAGHQAGLSEEAILALASTTASMGVEAEAGGGALSRVFNGITLDIATATDESKILADAMGLSLAELRTAWDQDAGKVFGDLLGYINELDQFEAAQFLSGLGITNTRDINALTLLSSGVEEYNRQLGVATGSTDELNKESDVFFNTTEGKWKTFVNNVRIAGDQIGAKLLPVVNDVMDDLVGRLSDPAVQKGIEEFATNLAEGVRDFVDEIRKADFRPLLDTMKGAAAIAKAAFDAFRSLPQPIQQLALAALVANKLTGGAVGQIAGGLGNIVKGVIQIAFGRGETPLRPMYTKEVGLGGGVGGTPVAGGGRGGLLGTAAALIGIPLAFELGKWLRENGPDLFPATPKRAPGTAPLGNKQGDAAGADTVLLQNFGDKLDKLSTEETLHALNNTTEIGLKGVGTSVEEGIKTGTDPLGDTMTAILQRAEDPKAPEVMEEIQGHIAALEEIQATYLATGDTTLAGKVQKNIDALHTLIGTTDTSRQAVVSALATEVGKSVSAIFGLDGKILGVSSKIDSSNALLAGINAKNFNPPAPKVSVTTNVTVSTSVIQNAIVQNSSVSGTRGISVGYGDPF